MSFLGKGLLDNSETGSVKSTNPLSMSQKKYSLSPRPTTHQNVALKRSASFKAGSVTPKLEKRVNQSVLLQGPGAQINASFSGLIPSLIDDKKSQNNNLNKSTTLSQKSPLGRQKP